MSKYLMVPIRLDALYVEGNELSVVEQNANFSVLPYFENSLKEEFNCETPNISEAIVSQPFQNKNLRLGHGVHLHWAMPDALTRGDSNLRFPRLPNRWLATRRKRSGDNWPIDKQWVVESDYLFPPGVNKRGTSVNIPCPSDKWIKPEGSEKYVFAPDNQDASAVRSSQIFRFMGRRMSLSAWRDTFEGAEYYPDLTAVGYGEPTFAAFYPNCFSVFGLHDDLAGMENVDLRDLRYEIVGWHSDAGDDELAGFMNSVPIQKAEFIEEWSKKTSSGISGENMWNYLLGTTGWLTTDADSASFIIARERSPLSDGFAGLENEVEEALDIIKTAAIEEKFNWAISEIPECMLCYAGLEFSVDSAVENTQKDDPVSITVANTPTEALSARLADVIATENNDKNADRLKLLEDQLEALQLSFRLDQKKLDTVSRFKELRHENGFTAVDGGHIWVIRKDAGASVPDSENVAPGSAAADPPNAIAEGLSKTVADALAEVNNLQREYDYARHEIESLRKQLFADWYKYMICVYPPDIVFQNYPDPDQVRYFIETKTIKPLNEKLRLTGELEAVEKDENGNVTAVKSAGVYPASIAGRLAGKIERLLAEIEREVFLKTKIITGGSRAAYASHGAFELSPPPDFADGKTPEFGPCLSCGGADYISVPDSDCPDFNDQNRITLEAWIYPTDAGANQGIISKGAGRQYALTFDGANKSVSFQTNLVDSDGIASLDTLETLTNTVELNKWTHVAAVCSGATKKVYVDGAEQCSEDCDLNFADNSEELRIGQGADGEFFTGKIAYIRVYQDALSAEGIKKAALASGIRKAEAGEAAPAKKTFAKFHIEQIPAPRYWQPNNPVVLIEGNAVEPTKRHGRDGTLACHIFDSGAASLWDDNFSGITQKVNETLAPDSFAFNTFDAQPWNPFLLEWQTQLYPVENGGNLRSSGRGAYSPEFITDNYEAPALYPDLELKQGKGKIVDGGKVYMGDSILTPQANLILKKSIEDQLINNRKVLADYCVAGNVSVPEDIADEEYLANNIAAITDWYYDDKSLSENNKLDDPVYVMLLAYAELKDAKILAQSLNGFNRALLMRKQTMELNVDDPLAFDEYKNFTKADVANAMGEDLIISPAPLNSFNPIRTGCVKVLRLRLVDTFGQTRDLSTDIMDTTYKMTSPGSEYLVKLPPRLAQPARLNFRWLNAASDQNEADPSRGSTPVCGWLLTNIFDKSVMFYDASGKALGYFKADGWREAVDSDAAKQIEEIQNPHLKRVAEYVRNSINAENDKPEDERRNFINDFIRIIDDALENIQPEANSGLEAAALLMGRPVAVVRASLNLELKGLPAVNQDWNVFRGDMASDKRTVDGFTKVKVPVRLGEYGQLNDGLIGYWLEGKSDAGEIEFKRNNEIHADSDDANVKFYSPQGDSLDSDAIESRFELDDGPINFYQSINDPPQTVSILMDARGSVHATVGILPNKEVSVPEEQYEEALKNIEVSFLHAPLLTRQGKIDLPLRPVSDYAWSWVERDNRITERNFAAKMPDYDYYWSNMEKDARITKHELAETLLGIVADTDALWNYLLSEEVKWLEAVDADNTTATLVAEANRTLSVLAGDFAGLDESVEAALPTPKKWSALWIYLLSEEVKWLEAMDANNTIARVVDKNDRASGTLTEIFEGLDESVETALPKKWRELFPENRIEKAVLVEKWNEVAGDWSGEELWGDLLSLNWLAPIDDNEDGENDPGMAKVVNKESRTKSVLEGDFAEKESLVETLLDLHSVGIDPVSEEAAFAGRQEIKEGWLKLRRKKASGA